MMQEWFKHAKLGIFIHWGIYAVNGIEESWSFARGKLSYDEYMQQLSGFTAEQFNAKDWAALIKDSGANYAVLTTKHHDGVALFDTNYSEMNVVRKTPAGRDLVAEYCKALREEGLRVGLYFSNTDWSDLDHMQVILDQSEQEILQMHRQKVHYDTRWGEVLTREESTPTPELTQCWERFMRRYKGQIHELLTNYGQIDLLWFDVMLERQGYSWDSANVKAMIETTSPKTVVNSRLSVYGDYETPELYIPLSPLDGPWELCTTFNESWGYQPQDTQYKTIRQIVRILCESISKGGNMLISIGPDAAGTIPAETEALMHQLGQWTRQYAEAVYPTEKGLPANYFAGGSTLSKDKKTLYLFAYDISGGQVMLNGVRTHTIKRITSLTSNRELHYREVGGAYWLNMPGCIWIDFTEPDIDPVCTVVKIEFTSEIDLVALTESKASQGEM